MLPPESSVTLRRACLILFGPEVHFDRAFLSYLQPEGLKAAFRSKALTTHPDRAQVVGLDREQLNEQFIKLVWAYEQLKSAISDPNASLAPPPGRQSAARTRSAGRPASAYQGRYEPPRRESREEPRFYQGQPPGRVLRLGEYLYYSGKVCWQDFMAALNWQKRQRPSFGGIAIDWNLLSQEDVVAIMADRRFAEPFGEAAMRKGLLTRFWVRAILHRQAKLQPRLGRFFVETGLLTQRELARELERLKKHNRRVLASYH